jgi:hypothetical protein
MEKNKNKGKVEKTGSEAHYKPFGLHFQKLGYTRDIRPEKITPSFTNTFNQTYRVCQGFRFDGVYRRFKNTIKLSSGLVLKIQERKHETKNKPKEYLSLYTIRGEKQKHVCYISSLFKIGENRYLFDYWFEGKKVYYIMELTDTTAIIKRSFLPLYTNRGKNELNFNSKPQSEN